MEIIRRAYRKHWAIYFCIGVFALAFIALQFTSYSIGARGEHAGILGLVATHIVHADDGDDGGGTGADSTGGGCCGGGDDGGGTGADSTGGGCCGADTGGDIGADTGNGG